MEGRTRLGLSRLLFTLKATIGELSSLGVIKFTCKYLKEGCIGGFIAQKVNKNHSYSIYRITDQKLWQKKLLVCIT